MTTGLERRFWTLWSALATANLADGLTLVALPLLALRVTDDVRLIALIAAARVLPFPLLGLPAGIVIDRFDRRLVAVSAQVMRASAVVILAALVAIERDSIVALCIVGFVIGAGEVFIDGGVPAMVRTVVRPDQLEVANERISASVTVTNRFVGPPLGALLFGVSATLVFSAAAVLYAVGIALLLLTPGSFVPAASTETDEGSLRKRLTRGIRYVWAHEVLRPLALAVALFSFVGNASGAVLVVRLVEEIGLSEFEFGLFMSVDAVVALLASFAVAALVRRTSHSWSMRFSVITYAAGSLILGVTSATALVTISAVLGGLSNPTWNVISSTVRQRLVPDEIFGRMMTAYLVIAWSVQPVGALAGGLLANATSAATVSVVAGVTVASLLLLARPMFRAVDAAMAEAVAGSQ